MLGTTAQNVGTFQNFVIIRILEVVTKQTKFLDLKSIPNDSSKLLGGEENSRKKWVTILYIMKSFENM